MCVCVCVKGSSLSVKHSLNVRCKQPLMIASERSKSGRDNFCKFTH